MLVGPGSPEAASRTQFAIELFVGLGINLTGLLVFLLAGARWGRLVLGMAQTGNIVFSLFVLVAINFDVLTLVAFTLPAAATLAMLVALRGAERSL